jgi:hypothetical protein
MEPGLIAGSSATDKERDAVASQHVGMVDGNTPDLPALERQMTDTRDLELITEALAIIDRGLGDMLHRELVSTDEVADLLLDVRMLLVAREPATTN